MKVSGSELRVPGWVRPDTVEEAAAAVRERAAVGHGLRLRGGGTKLDWVAGMDAAAPVISRRRAEEGASRPATRKPQPGNSEAEGSGQAFGLDTCGLNRVLEHNEGDFTAVLEAGVRLADAQAIFARAGQMLALDPPLGAGDAATIGGIVATADSGPLRHRYGSVRELVLGVTVVLSDGAVSKSGGKVIKNVAGYDLAKLFAGSYGTLGLIARVALRLHPLATVTATAAGASADPDRLAATALALARLPLEADSLDVLWSNGAGRVLVRFSGVAAAERARAAASRLDGLEGIETITDDEAVWARQRAFQRAPAVHSQPERSSAQHRGAGRGTLDPALPLPQQRLEESAGPSGSGTGRAARGIVLKVSGRATDLAAVLRAAQSAGGTVVSRAALGLSWVALPAAAGVDAVRQALAPRACTVLDGADRVTEPWPAIEPGTLALMKRIKERFDPAGMFQTGSFVGSI